MILFLGLLVILLTIVAILRRVDVRLCLLLGGLALGTLAGQPATIVRRFLETFSNERFVVPLCTAMGFAYVVRLTECDRHLVHLLIGPVRKVRLFLIPGTVLVAWLVNIAVRSEAGTAAMIGPAVIPILLAAGIPRPTIGGALLLGSSIGGVLLNPAASDLRVIVVTIEAAARAEGLPREITAQHCIERILPLGILSLAVATTTFWVRNRRTLPAAEREPETPQALRPVGGGVGPSCSPRPLGERGGGEGTMSPLAPGGREVGGEGHIAAPAAHEPPFRVHWAKALVPLVPLLLLYLSAPPLQVVDIPRTWLETASDDTVMGRFESRLAGAAMLVGVAAATLVAPQSARQVAGAFFEGAGYAFGHIISLIVAANCFGQGLADIGLARRLADGIQARPVMLLPAAGLLALGFPVLCGSGVATTQSLFGCFAVPALRLGLDPAHVGAVMALAAAAGRTMSPAAAVVLMTATLTKTDALVLIRRVAVPLLAAVAAVIVAAQLLATFE